MPCANCKNCFACRSLQKCSTCKECTRCTLCQKCSKCDLCRTLRQDFIGKTCESCSRIRDRFDVREVDIYCCDEDKEICAKCAAKYHKKCTTLLDTYELVVETQKYIDVELGKLKGAEDPTRDPQEDQPITIEETTRLITDLTNHAELIEAKKTEMLNKLVERINAKAAELKKSHEMLLADLSRMANAVKKLEQTKEERKQKLSEDRVTLGEKIKDACFVDVLKSYRAFKREQDSSTMSVSRRYAQKLRDRAKGLLNDSTIQDLQKNTENLFVVAQDKYDKEFQPMKACMYLLNPYSFHMYLYDIETNEPTIIKLIDQEGHEFRYPYNCSTVLVDNRILLIGGTKSLSLCGKQCWEYSMLHDRIIPLKDMRLARREHAVTVACGCVYSVGGWCEEGLTDSCEKIALASISRGASDQWDYVRKLNICKSALSLSAFPRAGIIYAIGGMGKNASTHFFERLLCVTDGLPDPKSDPEYKSPQSFWELITVATPLQFCVDNPTVGTFCFVRDDVEYLLLFTGGETKETSEAFLFSTKTCAFEKARSPMLQGTGSLHDRKPLYTNNGEDIYFVGFYDILHFNVSRMDWLVPVETSKWISYK
jgi:hypothetical protein